MKWGREVWEDRKWSGEVEGSRRKRGREVGVVMWGGSGVWRVRAMGGAWREGEGYVGEKKVE